jgi:hypothetical protein
MRGDMRLVSLHVALKRQFVNNIEGSVDEWLELEVPLWQENGGANGGKSTAENLVMTYMPTAVGKITTKSGLPRFKPEKTEDVRQWVSDVQENIKRNASQWERISALDELSVSWDLGRLEPMLRKHMAER